MMRFVTFPFVCSALFGPSVAAVAESPRGTRINNLKVLSSRMDDVTTPENILKSFVKPGMSDAERAKALWTAAVRYRHQTAPPNEFLAGDWEAHDPVKLFNVYGYCMCCCCSSILEALNRLDGREARGRILNGHSVPETYYGDAWHMYDCSLITLFPRPGDGKIAGVDDISSAVNGWYADHPEYKGNGGKLVDFMRQDGWMGWKNGPALLASCPYYKAGYFPARTHGWDATMQEYARKSEVYEYGYQLGYRALFSLRPGESLERDAGNRGLHVNQDFDSHPGILDEKAPNDDLVYLKDFLPGYNGGIVGNGRHIYSPLHAAGGIASGAEIYENLAPVVASVYAPNPSPIHPANRAKAGIAVIPMASPYVYLGGQLSVRGLAKGAGQALLSVSTNGGRSFVKVWSSSKPGPFSATIDLKPFVMRRYAFWVKIELRSGTDSDAELDDITISCDIQHAPRTLAWLGKGDNTITIAADSDTKVASKCFTGRITADKSFDKNETTGTLGATFENMRVDDGACWWTGGTGTMTLPIETPSDIVDLRFGGQFRVRGDRDLARMLLSFDDGKSWTEAAQVKGPTPGFTRYFKFDQVPAGTRKALLRYEFTGNNTAGMFSFRADADYKDPVAANASVPWQVVHVWNENGVRKEHRETITSLPHSYHIETASDPEMVSVTCRMP